MMHRTTTDAVRSAYAALQAGRFAQAARDAAPWVADPAARLLHALGQAGSGEIAAGAASLDAIARANPGARHPVHDLVALLQRCGRAGEAAEHLRAALLHRPDDAGLLGALGTALSEAGDPQAMLAAFRAAASRRPDAASWANLGKAEAAAGTAAAAEHAFDQAARLAPGDPQLRLNHGVARLRAGRLADGWALFRARHALPGRAAPPPGPELSGLAGVAGRRVLLLHDEGFGDTLQFIRYAPLLAALGARVQAAVPPPLRRLLAGSGIALADGGAAPDTWCRIPDLPSVFGTTLDTIPAALPYLVPDPALVSAWAGRLPPGARRVGLVWAGAGRTHDPAAAATDRVRSLPPARLDALLAPLLAVPGVRWISLQHGVAAPDGVFDPMGGVADFADTAAILASLDLVVSVDTAVAHLAAATGRRVLLLDRYDNCWRWLRGRTDSPWYPGLVRIIRQREPGGWDAVLAAAAAAVADG